jgi:hypothetical protein
MTPSQESLKAGDGHGMAGITLTWLGAAYGLFAPGWQGSFRVSGSGEPRTIVISLDASETDAIARHLDQTKLDKRQAELILQHAGRELIEAAFQSFALPDEVRIETTAATRADDLRRWRVLPAR